MLSVLVWWLAIQVVALLALPITYRVLRFLPDRGIGMARPVGLLLVGYAFWLLVTLGLLRNTATGVVAVLLGVGSPRPSCGAGRGAKSGRSCGGHGASY